MPISFVKKYAWLKNNNKKAGKGECWLVFSRHVLEHGEVFHLYKDDGGFHVTVKDTADEPGGVVYLRDLVTLLHEGCLQTSRSNPLLAAQQATGHGERDS